MRNSPFSCVFRAFSGQQSGFTLIEVLITFAIVSTSMAVLMQLFNSVNARIHKAAEHAQLIIAEKQIYQAIYTQNPQITRSGNGQFDQIKYSWQAEPKPPEYPIYNDDHKIVKKITLFSIKLQMQLPNGQQQLRQWETLGWEDIQQVLSH